MHRQAFDPQNTCFKSVLEAKKGSNPDTLAPATTFIHSARKHNALKNCVITNGGLQIGMYNRAYRLGALQLGVLQVRALQVGALQMALFGSQIF